VTDLRHRVLREIGLSKIRNCLLDVGSTGERRVMEKFCARNLGPRRHNSKEDYVSKDVFLSAYVKKGPVRAIGFQRGKPRYA
jgi:hypothetical protein